MRQHDHIPVLVTLAATISWWEDEIVAAVITGITNKALVPGGLVQHNTIYYDGATFARQIGLLPAQGASADRALIAVFNAKTKLIQRYQDAVRRRQARAR